MEKTTPLWPDPGLADQATLTWLSGSDVQSQPGFVLVCPGGGYGHLAAHEAEPIGRRLMAQGFHAGVLRYRLGSAGHRHPAMLHDVQRAVRMVRARGYRQVAVLGFSAGGHLASMAATMFDQPCGPDDDLAGCHSARPDAAVLCYPVIDLTPEFGHVGSSRHLLGPDASLDLQRSVSTHTRVTQRTPPVFIWHTADDPAVDVRNALAMASACRAHQVPMELHVYATGRHGLGQAEDHPQAKGWIDLAVAFLNRYLSACEASQPV